LPFVFSPLAGQLELRKKLKSFPAMKERNENIEMKYFPF
jgi:hypothetical protein